MEKDPLKEFEEESEESVEETEILPNFETIQAISLSGKIILPESPSTRLLFEKSYIGTENPQKQIEIDVIEALLLLERNRIQITDKNLGITLTSSSLLTQSVKNDPKIWTKFLIYRDLRQRGYMVRLGYGDGIDFRVFPRGSSRSEGVAKYFIFILAEGDPMQLELLERASQQAISARKELIIAIIDRLGEPTYYALEQFKLSVNTSKTD